MTTPHLSVARWVSGSGFQDPAIQRSPPITSQRKRRRRGFTLIETSLAMLAIGLGVLAVFGLGRLGLRSAKEAENSERCARLAGAVFETLRATNERFAGECRTNLAGLTWHQCWENTSSSARQIPFPLVAEMSGSENLYLTFTSSGSGEPQPAYDPAALSLREWNPRYRLHLYDDPDALGRHDLIHVLLEIYPDGDTYSSEARLYHTTLSDAGGLP